MNRIQSMKRTMSQDEIRELKTIETETSRRLRNFWVKAMKNRGYSNVAIAEEFGMAESSIRAVLDKDKKTIRKK